MNKLLMTVAVLTLVGCGAGGGKCRTGSVSLSSAAQSPIAAVSPPVDLPSEFNYGLSAMRGAIEGTWLDSGHGLTLTVRANPQQAVTYEVAAEGSDCLTWAVLSLDGTWLQTTPNASFPIGGTFTGLENLDGAMVVIEIMRGDTIDECHLELHETQDPSPARLEGTCQIYSIQSTPIDLSFVRG